MNNFFVTVFGVALANNVILNNMIGVDTALASMRRHDVAYAVAGIMLVVLPVTVMFSALITHFILLPLGVYALHNFVFILLIIVMASTLKYWTDRHLAKELLPFATINTLVLGTVLLNQQHADQPLGAFLFGLGTALGFALALSMMVALKQRMETADVPSAFKGHPIMLITLGFMSMAFMGFTGLGD